MRYLYDTLADRNDYFFIWDFDDTVISPHFHKSIEFVYCLKGETDVYINGNHYLLHENEIYFVDSYALHSNKSIHNNSIIPFVFSHNFFHDFERTYPGMSIPNILNNQEANKVLLQELLKMREIFNEYNYVYYDIPFLKRQAMINEFLYLVTKYYPVVKKEQNKNQNSIIPVLHYINEHAKEPLSLTTLACHYGYSTKYFSNMFNQCVGTSINNYINSVRIENTLERYNNPDNKEALINIALEEGFNSVATFYRVLKQDPQYKKDA